MPDFFQTLQILPTGPTGPFNQKLVGAVQTSGGTADAGKLAVLNPQGQIDSTLLGSTGATFAPWATLTGDLTEGQAIPFDGPTVGTPDTTIFRVLPGVIGLGTGGTGATGGSLELTNLSSSGLISGQTAALDGAISTYLGTPTVAAGVPSIVAALDLTGQTGPIGSTTLYAVPATGAGMYRTSYYVYCSQAGSGGSVSMQIGWTNEVHTNLYDSSSIGLTPCGLTSLTDSVEDSVPFYSVAGESITYATTMSASSGSPQYGLRIRVEYLG